MYTKHKQFFTPTDETTIWKYMSFFKLMDLMHSSSLYFLRTDKFLDRFEGKPLDINTLINRYEQNIGMKITNQELIDSIEMLGEMTRMSSYINCWHINSHESSVMWDAYSNPNGGVVIKSTIGKLKQALIDPEEVYISKVIYGRDSMELNNALQPLIYKKMAFANECELRLFISPDFDRLVRQKNIYTDTLPVFRKIKIDYTVMVDEINIHPLSENWICDNIKQMVKNFNPNIKCDKSQLYSN